MANTLAVRIRQIGPTSSEATIRDHRLLVDRPVEKGVENQGPLGGELLLAAYGGCFMSNLLAAIKARQATITNVRASITGTLADAPSRFAAIEMTVTADGAVREELEKLLDIAGRGCIVTNTLRDVVALTVTIAAS